MYIHLHMHKYLKEQTISQAESLMLKYVIKNNYEFKRFDFNQIIFSVKKVSQFIIRLMIRITLLDSI